MVKSILNFIDLMEKDVQKNFKEEDNFRKGAEHVIKHFRHYMNQWARIRELGQGLKKTIRQMERISHGSRKI